MTCMLCMLVRDCMHFTTTTRCHFKVLDSADGQMKKVAIDFARSTHLQCDTVRYGRSAGARSREKRRERLIVVGGVAI